MLCARCQRTVDPGAIFCGNCGLRLQVADSTEASTLESSDTRSYQTSANPGVTALTKPTMDDSHQSTPGASDTAMTSNTQTDAWQPPLDHSGKAIASFILGVLGLPATLIPIVGIVFGVLAIVFGTLSIRSSRKVFAIIGMSLAVIVLLVSIFLWVRNTQELVSQRRSGTAVGTSEVNRKLQAVATPCFTTKIPADLAITRTDDSCTFLATNAQTGEQEQVKVLQVPQLTLASLATAAKGDADNVVSTIPGGSIVGQRTTTFSGSQAYEFVIKATDGSAGTISYVYNTSAQGNLVIVLHTQARANEDNFGLTLIESNWSWL